MPVLRVQAAGRLMSDFSFSVRCPFCGGRYAPDDGSCCEPPDEEEGEEGGVGMDDGPEAGTEECMNYPGEVRAQSGGNCENKPHRIMTHLD